MVISHLPAPPTPFVGRDKELPDLQNLLADPTCRLLTLVGPGGIGKTRLALEAASQEGVEYLDGVHFVPLQALTSSEFIVPAIAEALNFQFFSGIEPKTQLLNYLCSQSMLLIMDNLEHLLDGVSLISDILAAATGVRVLATSRERLNLLEEWVFDVGGLQFPSNDAETDIVAYSAVRLFTQNARRVRPGFGLNGEQAAVIRICRFVEGMPLGIELASSWARTLSCHEIAQQLERGLDILTTPSRNMPERHRNMRTVLDHSWVLLSADEQAVFARLSVFRGGFALAAAEWLAGATLERLAALVDKSWLHGDPHGGRYDIHELLRQYGAEQLQKPGDSDAARNAHSEYFAEFMRQREKDIKYQRQIPALDEIERDFDNIRAAWSWAISQKNDDAINRMTEALNLFCDMRARWPQGEAMFHHAMTAFAQSDDLGQHLTWSRLLARRARMIICGASKTETFEELQFQLQNHVAVMRMRAELPEVAFGLYMLAIQSDSDYDKFIEFAEESFCIYCALDDRFYMPQVLKHIALPLLGSREMRDIAKEFLRYSLELSREVGDHNEMSWSFVHLGDVLFDEGQFAEAELYFEEAEARQRESGNRGALTFSLVQHSLYAFLQGKFEKATVLADEAMTFILRWNIVPFEHEAFAMQGIIKVFLAEYEEGENLCKKALSVEANPSMVSYEYVLLGQMILAYRAEDLMAMQQHFQTARKLHERFPGDTGRLDFHVRLFAPMAVLWLVLQDRKEWAVVFLSGLNHLPPHFLITPMGWLENWPLFSRLRAQLQTELGQVVYAAAFEHGKRLDLAGMAEALFVDFPHSLNNFLESKIPHPQRSPDALTARELEILQLMAAGLSNTEIAQSLYIALATVKVHSRNIFSKLNVSSRTQAIAQAQKLKLL